MANIELKNAKMVFPYAIAKYRAHDMMILIEEKKNIIPIKAGLKIMKHINYLSDKYGDFEVLIERFPSRIKIRLI
jgi:hypothetical protein